MKIVVDTNRVIAALIRDSSSRYIIMHLPVEFLAIKALQIEVEKYKPLILKKTGIAESDFTVILERLYSRMVIIPDAVVQTKMQEAIPIMEKIDSADTPFIATALACEADIWSEDKHFLKQAVVKTWKTSDLLRQL